MKKENKKAKLEFSAGGIVYKIVKGKPEIALILDSYGRWALPKGHIENKEDPEIAARREIEEEIGLKDLKLIDELPKSEYWFKLPVSRSSSRGKQGELIHKFLYLFLFEAESTAKLTPLKSEIKDAKWMTLDEIKKLELYDSLKDPVKFVEIKLKNMLK